MVDLQNKIIYFGYGDVSVISNQTGRIWFQSIKPSCECGEDILDRNDIELGEMLIVVEDHPHDLYKLFTTVSKENTVVRYKDVTFNFTNYNQKSVEVCKKCGFNTVNFALIAC